MSPISFAPSSATSPSTVTAMTSGRAGDVEAAGTAIVRFARGAVGTISASWSIHPGPDHLLTLFGTTGTLHLDGRTPLTHLPDGGEPERVELPAETTDPARAFVAAIADNAEPVVTGVDGRAALAIIEAAYQSAASGTTVTIEESPWHPSQP